MGRFLTLLLMMMLVAVAQPPNPYLTYLTRGGFNGRNWRAQSEDARVHYVTGAVAGYAEAYFEVVEELRDDCYATLPTMPFWFRNVKPTTMDELVKEVDSFYQDRANISLPILDALHYVHMKLAGATREELDKFKADAFKDNPPRPRNTR